MDPDDARSEYQGWWIYIDPDEHLVELVDLDLDLDTLCDLLRCDATDLIELDEPFLGYVDGEGEWQERQTRWHLQGRECWGRWWSFVICPRRKDPALALTKT